MKNKKLRILSIDIGMNNLAAITNNIGLKPLIIRGKKLKALNQWYNRMLDESKGTNTTRLERSTESKLRKEFDEIVAFIERYACANGINTVCAGRYEIIPKKNFRNLPIKYFLFGLSKMCARNRIKYEIVDEKYTSGTSFLDNEPPVKGYYDKSRRVKHLFYSKNGVINADINDSYQIMRKAHPELFKNGIEGYKTIPMIIKDINEITEV